MICIIAKFSYCFGHTSAPAMEDSEIYLKYYFLFKNKTITVSIKLIDSQTTRWKENKTKN